MKGPGGKGPGLKVPWGDNYVIITHEFQPEGEESVVLDSASQFQDKVLLYVCRRGFGHWVNSECNKFNCFKENERL